MAMRVLAAAGLLLAGTGCSGDDTAANGVLPPGPQTNVSAVAADAIPADVAAVAEATVPGMRVDAAERKEREGRVYYDVEGKRADGSEVEIDMLVDDGKLRAVEVQRDLAWADVPVAVAAVAKAAPGSFAPERVIESRQVDDGSVIYELFAPGRRAEPAMEVRVKDGKAEVLGERWAH